jgi:hypothetical protein
VRENIGDTPFPLMLVELKAKAAAGKQRRC